MFPSLIVNGDKLLDRLFVHAHGIINGKSISRGALLDITGPAHTRNVRDARE